MMRACHHCRFHHCNKLSINTWIQVSRIHVLAVSDGVPWLHLFTQPAKELLSCSSNIRATNNSYSGSTFPVVLGQRGTPIFSYLGRKLPINDYFIFRKLFCFRNNALYTHTIMLMPKQPHIRTARWTKINTARRQRNIYSPAIAPKCDSYVLIQTSVILMKKLHFNHVVTVKDQ